MWWRWLVSARLVSAASLSARLGDILTLSRTPFAFEPQAGTSPGGLIADIGCDHGFLGAELVANGKDVVAIDLAQEPLNRARHHFTSRGLSPRAFVLGDGLSRLDEYCETAIFAGVGGHTAAHVLLAAATRDDIPPPRRWILQPTQQFIAHIRELRLGLHACGYTVLTEIWRDDNPLASTVVRPKVRRGRRYLVTILAERGGTSFKESCFTELEILVGHARNALDATPRARLAYIKHHRDWLASLNTGEYRRTTQIRRIRRWHSLLSAEAERLSTEV